MSLRQFMMAVSETQTGSNCMILLSWIIRLFPDLTVKGFDARVNGEVCFDALRESMLLILFDKNWNMVKVGCRGLEVASPQILLSAHTIPFRLIVR